LRYYYVYSYNVAGKIKVILIIMSTSEKARLYSMYLGIYIQLTPPCLWRIHQRP